MFKQNNKFAYAFLFMAVLMGVLLGTLAAWYLLGPRDDVINCRVSGGAIVIQDRGPIVCVERS